jgi:hypothetical protein
LQIAQVALLSANNAKASVLLALIKLTIVYNVVLQHQISKIFRPAKIVLMDGFGIPLYVPAFNAKFSAKSAHRLSQDV